MNVGLIFSRLGPAAKGLLRTTTLLTKKHAPELMISGAVAGLGLTVYETVKATNKTHDILEYKDHKEAMISQEAETNEKYTEAIQIMDEKDIRRNTRINLVKAWTPVGLSVIFVLVCVGGAYKIINGRYVAVSAAYEGLDKFIQRYRANVRDEFGNEVDWRMAHSIKADEMAEERKRQNDIREREEEAQKKKRLLKPRTQYDRHINNQILDINSCRRWQRYWLPSQFIDFIQMAESKLQDKVDTEGHAVLNDAYDILGMPRTAQGAVVGWIQTPRNKHNLKGTYVSLGWANNEMPEEEVRRILATESNEELYAWITPNCDGVIYNLIDVPFHQR